jgi:putative DNA methylase
LTTFGDLFSDRQLVALTTFSDLVSEAREQSCKDGMASGLSPDPTGLVDEGRGAAAYADAVATYLAFGVDRLSNRLSTGSPWNTIGEKIEQTFGRQAIPMVWNFAEANVFSDSTGGWTGSLEWIPRVLDVLPETARGYSVQGDAAQIGHPNKIMVATDPPYYDNIGYADLSDFFYIWLRRALQNYYPDLLRTLLVPKSEELISSPYRHEGNKNQASKFFEDGLRRAFRGISQVHDEQYPFTLFYAFKQTESHSGPQTSQSLQLGLFELSEIRD